MLIQTELTNRTVDSFIHKSDHVQIQIAYTANLRYLRPAGSQVTGNIRPRESVPQCVRAVILHR